MEAASQARQFIKCLQRAKGASSPRQQLLNAITEDEDAEAREQTGGRAKGASFRKVGALSHHSHSGGGKGGGLLCLGGLEKRACKAGTSGAGAAEVGKTLEREDSQVDAEAEDEEAGAQVLVGGRSKMRTGPDGSEYDADTGASRVKDRSKRFRNLLKMLSQKAATAALQRLRLHMWGVVAALVLAHVVAVMVLLVYLNRQSTVVADLASAGEVLDKLHFTALYARAVEAATRKQVGMVSG